MKQTQQQWSESEKQQLQVLVLQNTRNSRVDWIQISQQLQNRSCTQCKFQYQNRNQKIGLVINKDKCEGTDPSSGNTTGVIEFLGQNIGINSEPIAVQIHLQTRIKALQKYDIPKFYQYLIFKQCIIPSANYGPFLEASITETQLADAKDKYDYMLAEAMEEILESDLLDVMLLNFSSVQQKESVS
ncbi:Putative_reverse transcriptase/endonuclease [Hexamita inflata]|uniref:Reverse transcriptase/endonuclease n=1 Tax=Hexamita inflata TaxID=28002 RepID=A0AA86V571_9EUKA|nr:Putative reverse transcriptase/endonuclease [Hexamita inflata]